MSDDVYLASIPLNVGALLRNANDRSAIERGALDLGYHVHGWLTRCLGKEVVRPFALRERRLLGYTQMNAENLQQRVEAFSQPGEYQVLQGPIQTKKMPALGPGQRVDFEVRVVPTVRLASSIATLPKGAEVDAYVAHVKRVPGTTRSRDVVYGDWLSQRMTRDGMSELHHVELAQRRKTHVLRRTQGSQRKAVTFELPEVSFRGTLTTGPGFHALLRHGVGRHKAFGFGMLLLRPPTC